MELVPATSREIAGIGIVVHVTENEIASALASAGDGIA